VPGARNRHQEAELKSAVDRLQGTKAASRAAAVSRVDGNFDRRLKKEKKNFKSGGIGLGGSK